MSRSPGHWAATSIGWSVVVQATAIVAPTRTVLDLVKNLVLHSTVHLIIYYDAPRIDQVYNLNSPLLLLSVRSVRLIFIHRDISETYISYLSRHISAPDILS